MAKERVIREQEIRLEALERFAQERLLEMEAKDWRCELIEAAAKERLTSLEEKEKLIQELTAKLAALTQGATVPVTEPWT